MRCSVLFGPAVGMVLIAAPMRAQQCQTDITGVWQFTANRQSYSGTADFARKGTSEFSGGFRFTNGVSTGIRYGQCPGSREVMIFQVADYVYRGGWFSSDGNSIEGGTAHYGGRGGTVLAYWTAKRIAGNGPPKILAVVNAASGAQGEIAAGEIVTIYGNAALNAIGPKNATALRIVDGSVSTSVAGVRVEFLPTGVFAPLTYVSAGQINAIVPYEVAGLSSVQVRVHFDGRSSDPYQLPVGVAAPGIFTANGSGTGQGAILNHDGILNTLSRREPRGGIITLFITGAGQTAPPGVTGRVTVASPVEPYTPQPLAPVAVRINGQPARVLFYGEAPGLVSGLVQLNVEIPTTISPGAVPVLVTVGAKSSREGVTVAVE